MKIGIICAVNRELTAITQRLDNHCTQLHLQRTVHLGNLHGQEVVAVIGGVGKVNAALTAQLLAERFGVERMIFTGIAGALSDTLKVGDVVIGTQLLYHDMDMSVVNNEQFDTPLDFFYSDPAMVELCKNTGLPLHYGRMATGDAFITGAQRDSIIAKCAPLCVDMESAAVAQVCWFYRLPLLIIRAISDFADDEADGEEGVYEQNAQKTADIAFDVMEAVLQQL